MTIVALSSAEFSANALSFSYPELKYQLATRLLGNDRARLESLVLLYRDHEAPGLCRGGMVLPQSPAKIVTAAWPVAETPEMEDRLLESYASTVAGMSPPRRATLLSEVDAVSRPHANRGPFVPLTEVVRYLLTGSNFSSGHDSASHLRWESHSPDEESAIELLQATGEDTLDMPELFALMDWRERLADYQDTSPRSPLRITSLFDRETPVGVAVWSVDPALREGEIHYVAVLPAERGRGWGKKLLGRVCSESRQRGADAIGLNVDLRNHFAIKLYEAAGFREVFRACVWISRDE